MQSEKTQSSCEELSGSTKKMSEWQGRIFVHPVCLYVMGILT